MRTGECMRSFVDNCWLIQLNITKFIESNQTELT